MMASALAEPHRVALYYAPEADDPLWTRGCAWLGRDPETGSELPQPDIDGIAAQVTEPRRYGFHATLKPPMQLTAPFDQFLREVKRFCREQKPFAMPRLDVTLLGRFIALCPSSASAELQAFADACVVSLDAYRRPEDAAAQAKRAAGRTDPQRRNIAKWGYPFVMEDWRFHMTLSNPTADGQLMEAAQRHFSEALALPRGVASVAVFVEPAKGEPFQLLERIPLAA
jgi:putative phosphonate metabolism protein